MTHIAENPGALAGATGADESGKKEHSRRQYSGKSGRSAMSKYARPAHKAAARTTGFALTVGTFEAWDAASAIWAARLTPQERAALAWAALKALDYQDARTVAETALGGAGLPIAPLFSEMDEAAFWADMASPEELEAYCLASFNAMPHGRQTAFLDFVQGRAAA